MIGGHGHAKDRPLVERCRAPTIAPTLLDQPGLVQELVAFENQLLVPGASKGEAETLLAPPPLHRVSGLSRPQTEAVFERRERRRLTGAPILPREIPIPALPSSFCRSLGPRLANESQIGDRQSAARPLILDAVAITKGIELFDIPQFLAGLPFDPGA